MARKWKSFSKFPNEIVQSGLLAALSNSALRIYLVLLNYSDWEEGWAFPSVKTISRDSGVNKNRISKGTEELVRAGLIEKNRERKQFWFRNTYRIIRNPSIDRRQLAPPRKRPCRPPQGKNGRFRSPKSEFSSIPHFVELACPQNADKN